MLEPKTQEVLSHCDPRFAREFEHLEDMRLVIGCTFEAAAILAFDIRSNEATIPVTALEFDQLFDSSFEKEGRNVLMSLSRGEREAFASTCHECIGAKDPMSIRCTWRISSTKDGVASRKQIHTRVSIQAVGSNENIRYFYMAIEDVTARYDKSEDLTKAQLADALRAAYAEVALLNVDTGVTTPIYVEGRTQSELSQAKCGLHAIFTSLHPEDKPQFWKHVSNANIERTLFGDNKQEQAVITTDLRRMGADREYHWVSLYLSKVDMQSEHRCVLICQRNIDEAKEAQRRERDLRSRAQLDGLTGIFNHATTEELVGTMLQGQQEDDELVFAIFDVDNFKRVNDSYGHAMGDMLLKCVASNIKGICRERDIVGRVGGDEFVALFSGKAALGIKSVQKRLGKCMEAIGEFSTQKGIEPPVTLSIGLVEVPKDATTYYEVFKLADSTLYDVKGNGKNGYALYRP